MQNVPQIYNQQKFGIDSERVDNSFLGCGISNSLDGSEDCHIRDCIQLSRMKGVMGTLFQSMKMG